jgi:hypothetical protein
MTKLRHWTLRNTLTPAARRAKIYAEDAKAKPYGHYVVIDHFLSSAAVREVRARFADADFQNDGEAVNHDSASEVISDREGVMGFFHSREWYDYLYTILDVAGGLPTETITALRYNRRDAHGFWPHIDDLPSDPKRVAVLIYLNENWQRADGGVLQMWRGEASAETQSADVLRWDAFLGKNLCCLDKATSLHIELGGPCTRPVQRLSLLDSIAPLFNRCVLMRLQPDRNIHSVTPSYARPRLSLLQWLR